MAAKISVIPALHYKDAKAAIEFLCTDLASQTQ